MQIVVCSEAVAGDTCETNPVQALKYTMFKPMLLGCNHTTQERKHPELACQAGNRYHFAEEKVMMVSEEASPNGDYIYHRGTPNCRGGCYDDGAFDHGLASNSISWIRYLPDVDIPRLKNMVSRGAVIIQVTLS